MVACTLAMPRAPEDVAPSFPERVGRYELLLPIGTGGMATVYLARVQVVGDAYREVALKLMHPFMNAEGRESSVSLMEEAKLAVRVRHPNVVPVIEVGDGPHGVYLVMDYVEGDTLSGLHRAVRAQGKTLPLPIAGRILIDALAGLHAAHELKDETGESLHLVHRDFSPQNILVGTDGASRLTDFGVAKAAGRVNVTSSGIIKGKVAYMAPEQALGKKVDRRCDVWAAGVVAWEVLAGQRLYKQEDQVATLLKIVNQPPPRVSSVRPDIPKGIDDTLVQALTMDVESRISTASELRRRLQEAWKEVGGLADPHEVGEFVRATGEQKIVARREQVSRVIKLRTSLAKVGRDAARAAKDASTPSIGTGRPQTDETTSAISASSLGRARVGRSEAETVEARRPGRRIGVYAAGGGAVLLAASLAFWLGSRTETARGLPSAAPASAAARTAEPTQPRSEPAPTPAPSSSAPAAAARITVEANAPIAEVRVGSRSVKIASPARRVEIDLAKDETSSKQTLVLVAVDQRRTSVELPQGATSAHAAFGAARTGPLAPDAKVVRESAKPPELPGLAPTPYEK